MRDAGPLRELYAGWAKREIVKTQKNPRFPAGFLEEKILSFFNQSGFDGFHRHQHALGAAIGQFYADALKVRAKLTLRDAGHVRTDAAALL